MLSVKRFSVRCLFFYCGIVLIFSQQVYGQTEEMADQYFAAEQFHMAVALYEQIYQSDTTDYRAAFQLGECYRHLFDYGKAQYYYQRVRTYNARNFPLSVFYNALMLKYNQHFEEAIRQFDEFLTHFSHTGLEIYTEQAKNEKQGCYLALLEQSRSPDYRFSRLEMPVNTEYNEYGPAIFRHDSLLVITSSRVKSTKGRINNRSGERFTDNLMLEKTGQGWSRVTNNQHFDITNTRWGDGSGCFNKEKNKYYFTSCGRKDDFCHIYMTELKEGRWHEVMVLNSNINPSGSSAKHPALSAGGDTLFFASDRPGGYGGTDIWMSISSGEEGWGPAVNLGEKVNTPFHEISPFYESKEKLLLFASNGHQGLGGMDIFLAESLGKKDISIQNPGKPFNSSKDDCYAVLGEAVGYMASNRDGSFDIYRFDIANKLSVRDFLLGNFDDSSSLSSTHIYQDMITEAGTAFPPGNENTIAVRSSEKERLRNGTTRFILSSDVDDILLDKLKRKAKRDRAQAKDTLIVNYTIAEPDSLYAGRTHSYPVLSLSTSKIKAPQKGEVNGKLFFKNDSTLKAVTLHLVTGDGKLAKISTTNQKGEFRFLNLEPDTVYHIFVDASSVPDDAIIEAKQVTLQAYGEEMNTFHYENIYFNFNQATLRKEARVVLDELADYYQTNPHIQIEINAFTDSTGNADYNLLLSQERGQSAFDYLIAQGVDRSAIVINAQGVSTSIASSNSFVSQQLNRRVEFEVIGKGIAYQPQYETRILKPNITLADLADDLHMSVAEIMRINGLKNEDIQAYKPVRVKKIAGEQEDLLFYDILKQ